MPETPTETVNDLLPTTPDGRAERLAKARAASTPSSKSNPSSP